jgi:hypothetical protein
MYIYIGWESGGGSTHSLDHEASDYWDEDEGEVSFDRTWHGTKVTREQMQSGSYEYSEVPRHGALRYAIVGRSLLLLSRSLLLLSL